MSTTLTVPATGARMPNIPLVSSNGRKSSLTTVLSDEASVVFFMRASTCPMCLGHARTLLKMKNDGELRGARVIIITPGDSKEAATVDKRLGTTSASVWGSGTNHEAVGLGKFMMLQHSGTFVIDDGGRVLAARTSAMPTNSFSKAEVKAALTGR